MVEKAGAQLIQGHDCIDDLFVIPKTTFQSPSVLWGVLKQLRHWKPDVAVDVQGLTKSSLLAFGSGARTRLGFHRSDFDGREGSGWLNNQLVSPRSEHISLRSLELLRPIGIESAEVEYRLPRDAESEGFAHRVHSQLFADQPFALINVGAGWPSKLWPSERYAEIVKHLESHWGLPSLVLWAGSEERRIANEIVEKCSGFSHLAPETTLRELRALIRRARLFVGSDTGPMHLSVAVDTPTVAMIGPMPIERVGPLGSAHRGVQIERLPSSRKSERKTNCAPMLSIQAGHVRDACDEVLERANLKRVG